MILKPLDKPSLIYQTDSLSVGNVRLTELKRNLLEQDHTAEFKGEDMSVIKNELAIRKINDSETIIDDAPSELFNTVKLMITEMLANV